MITIRDVAKYAGVSLGTVSNVLNDVPTVTEENRKLVEEAIAHLGYRRNLAASQLRSNRTSAIGLVIPDITNPFYPEVARGVEDAAHKAQYNVFLCNKDRSVKKEEEVIDVLLSRSVEGILLMKPRLSTKKIQEITQRCALVLIDANPSYHACDTVNADDYQGIEQAVTEAVRMGHRRIAFIMGLQDSFSSVSRLTAYRETMQRLELPAPPEYLCQGDFTPNSGRECLKRLMACAEPPTAVIAANDLMALGALIEARELGIRVPEELSVMGYDDIKNVEWFQPALTTTWYPKYEMGESAARLLFERIEARRKRHELSRRNLTLQTQLRQRDTLARPAQE